MQLMLTIAYTLSALLPIIGLIGLYRTARKEVQELKNTNAVPGSGGSAAMITHLVSHAGPKILERPRQVIRDFVLIGGGVLIGAAASISALFL